MNRTTSPNEPLIGRPDARRQLVTPALVLDLDRLERNLAAMAEWAADAGVALRPHAKTHKSIEIARRQIGLGAAGVCCATLGEARVMTEAGIGGVLLTSPPSSPAKARGVAQLANQADLRVVVDHPTALDLLAVAADSESCSIGVLIDFDLGSDRTGVTDWAAAIGLAERLARAPRLHFAGVQAYAAHAQHVVSYEQRRRLAAECAQRLGELLDRLRETGYDPPVVTGSGTGACEFDAHAGLYTELQSGSYVFMDTEYQSIEWEGTDDSARPRFESSLFVAAAVISLREGAATVDAGQKAVFRGGPQPRVATSTWREAEYTFAGDEHGRVTAAPGVTPSIGDVLELEAPHCDPTVALHDWYCVVRGDELVDVWPLDARGH